MLDHLIFLIYIIIFIFSTVGYGLLFSKLINENYFKLNIRYNEIFFEKKDFKIYKQKKQYVLVI